MSGNSWGAKHKGMLAIAGAAAATALTMGAASPALAAALGGTAAAEGAGAGAGLLGAGAAGTAAADTAAAGLGGGTAALFGPTAGGAALAGETGAAPFLTGGAAGGMGGGTASLFGGAGLPAADLGGMYTAGLGTGEGGASLPTFADKINSGLSNMLPGGNDTLSSLKSGMGKLAKAQNAYSKAQGLLGGQPQGGGGGAAPPSRAFGSGASPTNFNVSQYTNQPNSMIPQQGQQLSPEMLALLLKLQGGMNG